MEACSVSYRNFTKDAPSGIEFRPVTRGEYSSILVCKTASPSTDKHNNSLYWEQMKLIDDNKPYYERDWTYNQGKFSDDWDEAYVMYGDTLRNFIKDEETRFKIKQWMFYIITEESARIINKRVGRHHWLYPSLDTQTRLKPVLKNKEAQNHFGDILSNLNFNESFRELLESFNSYTPGVQEVHNFKLTAREQKIVDILVHTAAAKRGYHINTEVSIYLKEKTDMVQVVEDLFGNYIDQIAGNFNFNEDEHDYNKDHAIWNLISSEIMQPYMNVSVLYDLIYDNANVDANDLLGLVGPISPSGALNTAQKAREYVANHTSDKINTTMFLFMYFDHKPETVRSVAEVFVKYAILANFKNTDYMFERSLKPATQQHFGGILGNL